MRAGGAPCGPRRTAALRWASSARPTICPPPWKRWGEATRFNALCDHPVRLLTQLGFISY
eukprot:scaffold97243_cov69-Phaeocystis_antarctica.AAC.1